MISQKAKDLVNALQDKVGGDQVEWFKAENDLLKYIQSLEDRISDYGWEASARHAHATGGWQ